MESIKDTLLAIAEAIRQHMAYILETGKYPLSRNSSKLLKTMKVEVQQARNAKGQYQGFTPDAKLVAYLEFYAEYLDKGRYSVKEKPAIKKVPLSVLLAWISKRRLRGRVRKGKGKGRFISNNQLAFMIQNSIYKNGIRGRHFIQPAFDKGAELFDIYINNQLLDDMTHELDTQLKFK
ncbi:hypothetical protein [Rufibacter soli]